MRVTQLLLAELFGKLEKPLKPRTCEGSKLPGCRVPLSWFWCPAFWGKRARSIFLAYVHCPLLCSGGNNEVGLFSPLVSLFVNCASEKAAQGVLWSTGTSQGVTRSIWFLILARCKKPALWKEGGLWGVCPFSCSSRFAEMSFFFCI